MVQRKTNTLFGGGDTGGSRGGGGRTTLGNRGAKSPKFLSLTIQGPRKRQVDCCEAETGKGEGPRNLRGVVVLGLFW